MLIDIILIIRENSGKLTHHNYACNSLTNFYVHEVHSFTGNGNVESMFEKKNVKLFQHMEKPFACNMCNFRAARLGNLTVHLRTHAGEKPFPCHLCGYSANHSSNLKSHIRNIHDKTIPYQKR